MYGRGGRREEGEGSVERKGEENGVGSGVRGEGEGRENVRGGERIGVGGGDVR
jgi:hypothetical protein